MKGDKNLRGAGLLAALVVATLLAPPACLAAEETAKAEGAGTPATSATSTPATGAAATGTPATGAPATGAAPTENMSDSAAAAKFDDLMKSVEDVEQKSNAEVQVPTTGTGDAAKAGGDLSGQVQTDAFVDENKPLFELPGSAKTQLPKPVAVKPSLESVKLSYKNGRWREALDTIAKLAPTDKTHYYAGLCYQGQGQLRAAVSEFQWVASYSKDPLLKYNASRALIAVGGYARARGGYQGQGNNFARPAYYGGSGGGGGGGGFSGGGGGGGGG